MSIVQTNSVSPEGCAANPTRVPVPNSVMPGGSATRQKGLAHSFMKGETIAFQVGPVPEGRVYKLSMGWIMDDRPTIFETYIPSLSDSQVTVKLSSVATASLPAGNYLFDVFSMLPGGRDARYVDSGHIRLHETVGARTIAEDPTEVSPTGKDAIPATLTYISYDVSPGAGQALAMGDTWGDIESIEGRWLRVYDMQLILSGAADGGAVSANLVDELGSQVVAASTVSNGSTEGSVTDISGSPAELAVGKTYFGKLTSVAGLQPDVTATLKLGLAISVG